MERYVDPNSGAAPQPGGYAGPQGAEKGFAMSDDQPLDKEQEPSRYVPPTGTGGEEKSIGELAELAESRKSEEEKSEAEKQRIEALSNPKKVLADLDEGDSASTEETEPGQEEEASNNASIEHEAVDLNQAGEDDGHSAPAGLAEGDSETGVEESGKDTYDPSQYSVEQVKEFLAANPDQAEAVKASERQGKNRKTITGDE